MRSPFAQSASDMLSQWGSQPEVESHIHVNLCFKWLIWFPSLLHLDLSRYKSAQSRHVTLNNCTKLPISILVGEDCPYNHSEYQLPFMATLPSGFSQLKSWVWELFTASGELCPCHNKMRKMLNASAGLHKMPVNVVVPFFNGLKQLHLQLQYGTLTEVQHNR